MNAPVLCGWIGRMSGIGWCGFRFAFGDEPDFALSPEDTHAAPWFKELSAADAERVRDLTEHWAKWRTVNGVGADGMPVKVALFNAGSS